MSYFAAGTMPVTHALAREYAVSDQWFAAVPSGTWPNRLFLVAGSSGGRVTNTAPTFLFDMQTVFDRLPDDRWAVYNDQIPNVTLIRHLAFEWLADRVTGTHFRSLERFDRDCQDGSLPTFSYIEPAYLGDAADDSHPPRDVLPSERLVARVYRSLRRSPLWGRSILLILYDEHGGFFDHVRPPEDVPSPGTGERGFGFARLGIRTPCLLVSPLVARGQVWRPGDGRFADHTSLIASVLRFAGAAPLTARDEGAADIWSVVTSHTPRVDDGPTLDTIETWLEGQERLVTQGDPRAARSGRPAERERSRRRCRDRPARRDRAADEGHRDAGSADPRASATARRRPVRGGARDPRGEHPEPSRRIAADRPAAGSVQSERTVVSRPIGA